MLDIFKERKIVIKGAGDLATGVACRLFRSGFPVIMTEIAQPLTVRRGVSLSDAVYEGEVTIEDMTARQVKNHRDLLKTLSDGFIPIVVDAQAKIVKKIDTFAVIDAIMAKKNIGTRMDDATFVVGLGPGFTAGVDVHAIVETKRGHTLGRVIWQGSAIPNTGVPGEVNGFGADRVIRAPRPGIFKSVLSIGTHVEKGDIVAYVGDTPILAPISGMLRGLLHDGVSVVKELKCGDVDPRNVQENCWAISDKALAIGGGVLEAVMMASNKY